MERGSSEVDDKDGAVYQSAASKLAMIAKKQDKAGSRLSSQDTQSKKHLSQNAMINAYAKTSSGLRTGSFR